MAGDQHVLAEELFFQGGAGGLVDAPGQAQVAGLLTGELPGHHPPHPGLPGHRLDLGFHFLARPAGLAAGEVPGIRRVRKQMHVGQPKAQQVREYLAGLAGSNGHRAGGDQDAPQAV